MTSFPKEDHVQASSSSPIHDPTHPLYADQLTRLNSIQSHPYLIADPIMPTTSIENERMPDSAEASNHEIYRHPSRSLGSEMTLPPQPQVEASTRLPDGCSFGTNLSSINLTTPDVADPNDDKDAEKKSAERRVIWVDFPPLSKDNPFHFSSTRKRGILAVAIFFTGVTAYSTSAYSIGITSMCDELGCTQIQGVAGLGLYAWGFAIFPLVLAPISEEFGRKWTYIVACFLYWILHLMMTLGKNIETILICRFLLGASGSIGATLVGGTISDIYLPEHRGLPMSLFAFAAIFFTGLGPVTLAWVENVPRLGWRWIQWIQFILLGAYFPTVLLIMRETRANIILRRRAARLRRERGFQDGGRYTAQSEVGKVAFWPATRQSLSRPLLFLVTEPIVTFFSIWISLAWGVFYTQIAGIPYIFSTVFDFSITSVGLVYVTVCIGAVLGLGVNYLQDDLYRRKVAVRGVEARLYAPMAAGIGFAGGCIIYAFCSVPNVHWMGACVALVIIIGSIMTIYITAFVYISECYGAYASSALAAQSFLRNMSGGGFTFFIQPMFVNLTPRWALFLFGCLAALLATVPFVAFFKGPEIRKRSRLSRKMMEEERRGIEKDQGEVVD